MKTLQQKQSGEWCIAGEEFTCGNSLYMYVYGFGWALGTIEYNDNLKYYFNSKYKPIPLSETVKVMTVADYKKGSRKSKTLVLNYYNRWCIA